MGLLDKLFGGKKDDAAGGAAGAAPAGATSGSMGKPRPEQKCVECGRRLLPGAPCPFCHPQQFGDALPEGTIAQGYAPQEGVTGMGGVMVANQLAQQHGAKGFLHVYQGANKGASMLLGTKVVTIGRSAEQNNLPLNDGGVSTKHCEVRPVDGGYQIIDVGSKNGTFVNDKRVKEKLLANGDLIAFGGTRIYVGVL